MHRPWTELAFPKQMVHGKFALCLHSYLLLFIFLVIEQWKHTNLSFDSGFSSDRKADCDKNSSFLFKKQLEKKSTMTKYPINLIFNPQQPEVQYCGYWKSRHYWRLHIKF